MRRKLCQPLRGRGHLFGLGRKDMPERDIRRARRKRAIHFHIVVRGKPKPQARIAYGIQVGDVHILLA